jgi:hypothetical protein
MEAVSICSLKTQRAAVTRDPTADGKYLLKRKRTKRNIMLKLVG